MTWATMTSEQRRITVHAMERYGGGFVARLGEAWQRADADSAARLGAAFPDLLLRYGPGSDAYLGATRIEAAP